MTCRYDAPVLLFLASSVLLFCFAGTEKVAGACSEAAGIATAPRDAAFEAAKTAAESCSLSPD